ncbi:MAG: hypothetical protein KAT27_08830 [Desulfobacterales bacterium]|nr:hypothetical protein [Desulfobacterales bacterium]
MSAFGYIAKRRGDLMSPARGYGEFGRGKLAPTARQSLASVVIDNRPTLV